MNQVQIEAKSKTYGVYIDAGIRHQVGDLIQDVVTEPISSVLVITDSTVEPLYLQDVVASFQDVDIYTEVIKSGEASKSFSVYEQVLTKALESSLDRKSLIVALGGGVVGDLAGFVAATYMRGIRFVQVPTTLLAHDSSVGGKVAINHPLGKNMIGSFHQPEAVFYDTEALSSLPDKEWRSGFAEVIKHGFIQDENFLVWLQGINKVKEIPLDQLSTLLKRSISVKAKIVQEDEQESGVRAYLNFGHTLGHAIESELGYGAITHGEAVVIGMVFALRVSEEVNQVDLNVTQYEQWFNELGYQTKVPMSCDKKSLISKMKQDKKAEAKSIKLVLLNRVGDPILMKVPPTIIEKILVERMEVESVG
ncbi:3-dehydroquinate synthase [Halalkalibacter krulwichiae]|uniref:3-dehydroquinate synthase n=1 Tax=Halalkalibacter krulwichiae TaxID=199441 RepID=A0A1X9MFL7_9BACI|nr:3-dehydroquinate synthase [Halalkalibacter krulwichiae]ARK30311.1 3-dehydroquinate synthase [Halalkalibacter krulwichiae]